MSERQGIGPGPEERNCPSCMRVVPRSRLTCPYCKVGIYRLLVQNEKANNSEGKNHGNKEDRDIIGKGPANPKGDEKKRDSGKARQDPS